MCKTDSWWEAAVKHREPSSASVTTQEARMGVVQRGLGGRRQLL